MSDYRNTKGTGLASSDPCHEEKQRAYEIGHRAALGLVAEVALLTLLVLGMVGYFLIDSGIVTITMVVTP